MSDEDLDKEVLHFIAIEKQQTEYFLSKYFSKDKTPTVEKPSEKSQDLWFKGLNKWGIKWSHREFELSDRNKKT